MTEEVKELKLSSGIKRNRHNPITDKSEMTSGPIRDTIEMNVIKRHPDFARMEKPFGLEVHVLSAFILTHSHLFTIYAWYLTFTGKVSLTTVPLFDLLFSLIGGFGITVGCHRYWSHRTFKANVPLQIILMVLQTMALQLPIYKWCLDHRLHHKYTDTDADPHNSKRGLFFSHVGWLFAKRHSECQRKMETFPMPDLENDPIVRFQSRWYWTLVVIFHTIIPVCFVHYFWGLPLTHCVAVNYRRYVLTLQFTWCVNSFAHKFGDKPYDKNISSSESPIVSFLSAGEGWHNYHHCFPWDYRTSEFGWKINMSTMFIDFFAWLGWAYDFKTASQEMIHDRLYRTGDGSHINSIQRHDGIIDKKDINCNPPPRRINLSEEHPNWGRDDGQIS